MGKWDKFYTEDKSSKKEATESHKITQGVKGAFANLLNNSTPPERKKIIMDLVRKVDDKLIAIGSPPGLSKGDDYGKYLGGIGYLLHKDLKTIPKDTLDNTRNMLIDNESWKTDLTGRMVPNTDWGLSKEDFKSASTETVLEYAHEKGLGRDRRQSDSIEKELSSSQLEKLEGPEDTESERGPSR